MEYGTVDALHHAITLDSAVGLTVTLSQGFGAVTGLLTDGGDSMDNAMVVLVPLPIPEDALVNSFPWTHLDETGRYHFEHVVPGRYRMIPFFGTDSSHYHDLGALREHALGYRDVTVLPGKTNAGIDFAAHQ